MARRICWFLAVGCAIFLAQDANVDAFSQFSALPLKKVSRHCIAQARFSTLLGRQGNALGGLKGSNFAGQQSSLPRAHPSIAFRRCKIQRAAGGVESDDQRPILSKLLEKTQRFYVSLASYLLTRLRWLATIKPQAVFILVFSTIVLGGMFKPRTVDSRIKMQDLPYSTFLYKVKNGDVVEASLGVSSVAFQDKDGLLYITRVPRAPPELLNLLDSNGVRFKQSRPTAGQMLVPYIGLVLYLGVVAFFGWQMLGKGVAGKVGRKAKASQLDRTLTFDDIAGIDEAKAQVIEVVDIMRHPERYRRLGARQPCGVLLVGPPGTGKTLLARVIASQMGLPFFYASGSDFVEMFVGRGAARVRELFARAEKAAPCVIFLDELDAVGKSRGSGGPLGQLQRNDEGEQTLNQLLACMDGIDTKNNGVVVIGATNRFDVIDDALSRPGRFDRVVRVPLPDRHGRLQVLRVHTRQTVLDGTVNLLKVADSTEGFSPAELSAIANEAIIRAAGRSALAVSQIDFDSALAYYKNSRGIGKGLFGGK